MAQGGPPKGWISKMAPNEPGDGISATESGSRAQTRQHVELRPLEKICAWRRVVDCFPIGFPLTCRSASCASESEVSSSEELVGKSLRRWRGVPKGE